MILILQSRTKIQHCGMHYAQLAEEHGNAYLHEMLRQVDPVSAEMIHANNVKRTIRALEYFEKTGEPISRHNEEERAKESPYDFRYFVLDHDERAHLYERIDHRVDLMLEAGLVKEVKRLRSSRAVTKEMVSMQGLGYKEITFLVGRRDCPMKKPYIC